MDIGAGLYMYDVVVKSSLSPISATAELLLQMLLEMAYSKSQRTNLMWPVLGL